MLMLRDRLRAELAESLSGPVGRAYLPWDTTLPVMDACTCQTPEGQGEAWVRLVRLDTVGTGDLRGGLTQAAPGCPQGWTVILELGVARCHPQPPRPDVPLQEQEITDVTLLRLSDAAALRRVVACLPKSASPHRYTMGTTVPTPPLGGCSGVVLQVQVTLAGERGCSKGRR